MASISFLRLRERAALELRGLCKSSLVMAVNSIKTINLTIAGPEDIGGLNLLTSIVFQDEFSGTLEVETFNEGLSNHLLRVRFGAGTSKSHIFLVRIHGRTADTLVDRNFEILCLNAYYQLSSAKRLYAVFKNGICYSYIEGSPLPLPCMEEMKYARLVADELARFHSIPVEEIIEQSKSFSFFSAHPKKYLFRPTLLQRIRDWIALLPTELPTPQETARYCDRYPKPSQWLSEVEYLEQALKNPCSPLVLCHGDIFPRNIIVSPDETSVTFIDLEYCSFDHSALDIAGYFCEVSGTASYVGYGRYPSPEFQREFVAAYLERLRKYRPVIDLNGVNGRSENEETENLRNKEIDRWVREADYFALACHMLWSIWAAIRTTNAQKEYDFLYCAITRANAYFGMKKRLMEADQPLQ
ncbi:unnamed protein product [Calicophoron daubneyi]|uniref:ethanolamine kinase n=1 Tax=Calicophoron daubneyi TaxID=300641 RepID=A0AAV2TA50_CALDB